MSLALRAQSAQESLFGLYDRLNERIKLAEERLTARHVPYTVGVSVSGQYTTDHYAIAKIKGEWRLCYGQTDCGYQDESDEWPSEWKPLIECSALDRVNSVKHLAKLEANLVETSEKFIPYVDKAIIELDKFLASTV